MIVLSRKLAAFLLPLAFCVGCGKAKPPQNLFESSNSNQDSGISILASLSQANTAEEVKTALQRLDTLTANDAKRIPLSDSTLQTLSTSLKLTEDEKAELTRKEFSSLDSFYLEESLLLRDSVRGLNLSKLPPMRQLEGGFDWVCRNVYLDERTPWPAPPWWTLESGCGTTTSRAYVALALFHQMGFDTCFVGPPELKTASATPSSEPNKSKAAPPIRAIGVRIDKELYLFDPVRGKPFFGSDGKKIATLAEVRSQPNLVADWTPASVKTDELKQWELFLAPPISALSARLSWLEKQFPEGEQIRFTWDLTTIQKRLETEVLSNPALKGAGCQIWAVADDKFNPSRVLSLYSADDTNRKGTNIPVRHLHRLNMVPRAFFPRLDISGDGANHPFVIFAERFQAVLPNSRSPRDQLLRGQFKESTAMLSELKQTTDKEPLREEEIRALVKDAQKWCDEVQQLTANLLRAQRAGANELAEAQQQLDQFLSDRNKGTRIQRLMFFAGAIPLASELDYLLALNVHERVERNQLRQEIQPETTNASLAESWQNAQQWWERYQNRYSQLKSVYPGRDAQVQILLKRCEAMQKKLGAPTAK